MSKDAKFMQYFPDDFAETKTPSRSYFFNILSTLHHDYLVKITAHANKERHSATGEGMKTESIQISESWTEQLKAMPYLSRKIKIAYSGVFTIFSLQRSRAKRSTY